MLRIWPYVVWRCLTKDRNTRENAFSNLGKSLCKDLQDNAKVISLVQNVGLCKNNRTLRYTEITILFPKNCNWIWQIHRKFKSLYTKQLGYMAKVKNWLNRRVLILRSPLESNSYKTWQVKWTRQLGATGPAQDSWTQNYARGQQES